MLKAGRPLLGAVHMVAEGGEQLAAHAVLASTEVDALRLARGPDFGRHFGVDFSGVGVQGDEIAFAHLGDRPAVHRLGRDVNGRGHFAGGARHAPVGHQRHLETALLQHAQRGHELVQFGHAVGRRTLKADDGDEIALELAALEGGEQVVLIVKDEGGRGNHAVFGFDRRDLDDGTPQIARHEFEAAVWGERIGDGPQNVAVERLVVYRAPDELAAIESRLLRVARQPGPGHGLHIGVQQPGGE